MTYEYRNEYVNTKSARVNRVQLLNWHQNKHTMKREKKGCVIVNGSEKEIENDGMKRDRKNQRTIKSKSKRKREKETENEKNCDDEKRTTQTNNETRAQKRRRKYHSLDDVFACNLTMSHSDNVKTEADRRQKLVPTGKSQQTTASANRSQRLKNIKGPNKPNKTEFIALRRKRLTSGFRVRRQQIFAHKYLFDINQMEYCAISQQIL